MKTKTLLAIILLLSPTLSIQAANERTLETTFIDDAPAGFVHIQTDEHYGDNNRCVTDAYVKISSITSISVREDTVDKPCVELITNELRNAGDGKFVSKGFVIDFKKKENAETAARRIMDIIRRAESGPRE